MTNPPKPWKAEYAKSSRSSCKTCKNPIEKEVLRLGKMVHATQFDGFMPMWNHAACILKEKNQIKLPEDVEGLELLRLEDQQKIRKYADGAGDSGSFNPAASAAMECGVEVSQTSRATCRDCSQKITKGEIRISTKPEGQGARSLAWYHAKCYMDMSPTSQLERFSGWNNLPAPEQATFLSLVKNGLSTSKGTKQEPKEDLESLQESTSKRGAKRKKAVESVKSKLARARGIISTNKTPSSNNHNSLELEKS